MSSTENKRVWIIIAAFNEAKTIKYVISDLLANELCNIIVIDDGSSDETSSIAKECGAHVLRHQVNRGQGAALQTGIEYAKLQGTAISRF